MGSFHKANYDFFEVKADVFVESAPGSEKSIATNNIAALICNLTTWHWTDKVNNGKIKKKDPDYANAQAITFSNTQRFGMFCEKI